MKWELPRLRQVQTPGNQPPNSSKFLESLSVEDGATGADAMDAAVPVKAMPTMAEGEEALVMVVRKNNVDDSAGSARRSDNAAGSG